MRRDSTLTPAKPKKNGHKCFPPPLNVTVAYLAFNTRDEAVFKRALDAINAGALS
jgi:hypothetical protein